MAAVGNFRRDCSGGDDVRHLNGEELFFSLSRLLVVSEAHGRQGWTYSAEIDDVLQKTLAYIIWYAVKVEDKGGKLGPVLLLPIEKVPLLDMACGRFD